MAVNTSSRNRIKAIIQRFLRWQTVRDAIGDLPDPTGLSKATLFNNHEFRDGAKCMLDIPVASWMNRQKP